MRKNITMSGEFVPPSRNVIVVDKDLIFVTHMQSSCPDSSCDPAGPNGQCPAGENCVAPDVNFCFVEPCMDGQRGECRSVSRERGNSSLAYPPCLPNSADPNNNCAKMTLLFDRKIMIPVSIPTIINAANW